MMRNSAVMCHVFVPRLTVYYLKVVFKTFNSTASNTFIDEGHNKPTSKRLENAKIFGIFEMKKIQEYQTS